MNKEDAVHEPAAPHRVSVAGAARAVSKRAKRAIRAHQSIGTDNHKPEGTINEPAVPAQRVRDTAYTYVLKLREQENGRKGTTKGKGMTYRVDNKLRSE
ncbi:hypothetical protein GOBAR_AA27904 [Gossypium barbadense]|uniref:Uncharacterized protein n=1 Tax=Gossypium barbadense TaxID=3634 RepID=A0A2P5WNU4_GOSBA|nr:hypothetical protein GOBAR_AA27904 [Gossypium barbadense]